MKFQVREKCGVWNVVERIKIGKTRAVEIIKNKDEIENNLQNGNYNVRHNFFWT